MSPFERLRGAHLTRHPVLEDVVFSLLSLLVVTVAFIALLAPQEPTIAYAAKPIGPNGGRITLYGSLIDEAGQPISGATITVAYKDGARAATAVTAADGTFSMTFNDGPGPFPVQVQVGNSVGSTSLSLSPSMKWGLTMTFVQPSSFVFVPLPGY